MTLTSPILGVVCHRRLGFDAVNLHAKFLAVPAISLGASQFKVGHVTMTASLLRVICHPYAGT